MYLLSIAETAFLRESSDSDSITLPVISEILVIVELSKFSICSSCSFVNAPSRRLNRTSCVRAISLGSLKVVLVCPRTFTPGLSDFLTTRGTSNLPSNRILKLTDSSVATLTRFYDPAPYSHLSPALSACSGRRSLCIARNFPFGSLHYFYEPLHNIA